MPRSLFPMPSTYQSPPPPFTRGAKGTARNIPFTSALKPSVRFSGYAFSQSGNLFTSVESSVWTSNHAQDESLTDPAATMEKLTPLLQGALGAYAKRRALFVDWPGIPVKHAHVEVSNADHSLIMAMGTCSNPPPHAVYRPGTVLDRCLLPHPTHGDTMATWKASLQRFWGFDETAGLTDDLPPGSSFGSFPKQTAGKTVYFSPYLLYACTGDAQHDEIATPSQAPRFGWSGGDADVLAGLDGLPDWFVRRSMQWAIRHVELESSTNPCCRTTPVSTQALGAKKDPRRGATDEGKEKQFAKWEQCVREAARQRGEGLAARQAAAGGPCPITTALHNSLEEGFKASPLPAGWTKEGMSEKDLEEMKERSLTILKGAAAGPAWSMPTPTLELGGAPTLDLQGQGYTKAVNTVTELLSLPLLEAANWILEEFRSGYPDPVFARLYAYMPRQKELDTPGVANLRALAASLLRQHHQWEGAALNTSSA